MLRAVVINRLPVEQRPKDLDLFGQLRLAIRRRKTLDPGLVVLMRRVAGSQPELESAVRQVVERGRFPGQLNGVPHRDVEHEGAEPDARRSLGGSGQHRERSRSRPDVVGYAEHIESGSFGPLGHILRVEAVLAGVLAPEPHSCRHSAGVDTSKLRRMA